MRAAPKLAKKDRTGNVVTYPLDTDLQGQHIDHPEQGKIELIALHCNCGRSIYVSAAESSRMNIVCADCDSGFLWQQLSFADLNAA
jgi:hypothetical protein